jgi:hypothetical protein
VTAVNLQQEQPGILWLKISVIYLLVGVLYGIVMSATHEYQLRSVHAHINLLGWASLAVAGLIYTLYPAAGRSLWGRVHFWFHNVPLPFLLVTLHFYVSGYTQLEPLLAILSIAIGVGILAFTINVFTNLSRPVATA